MNEINEILNENYNINDEDNRIKPYKLILKRLRYNTLNLRIY